MENSEISPYWAALNRILTSTTQVVSASCKISYDSVALEAGRGRGSLKATRAQHREIREAIVTAASKQTEVLQSPSKSSLKKKIKEERQTIEDLKRLHVEILGRELMLLRRIDVLEREIAELQGLKVVPWKKRND